MQIACPESQGLLYEYLGRWFVKRAQLVQRSTTHALARARRDEHSSSSSSSPGASGSHVPVGGAGGPGQTVHSGVHGGPGQTGSHGHRGVAHVFDRLIYIGEGVASEFGIGALSALSQDAQHGAPLDGIGDGGGTGGAQRGALGNAPNAQNDAPNAHNDAARAAAAAAAAAAGALLPSSAAAGACCRAGAAAHASLVGQSMPNTALIRGAEPSTALIGGAVEAADTSRIAPPDTAPAGLSRWPNTALRGGAVPNTAPVGLSRWQFARQLTLGAGRSHEMPTRLTLGAGRSHEMPTRLTLGAGRSPEMPTSTKAVITGTAISTAPDGHLDYLIAVAHGGEQWEVRRRYTEFRRLHASLLARGLPLGPLGAPKILGKHTASVLRQREEKLQAFLNLSLAVVCDRIEL